MSSETALVAIDNLAGDEGMTAEERLSSIRAILLGYFTITDPATVPPYK